MFGLTGLPLYIGAGALIVIIVLSGVLWVQTNRVEAKNETIKALTLTNEAWVQKVDAKEAKIQELYASIATLNTQIEDFQQIGIDATAKQREIDALQGELAQAKGDLRLIVEKYRELRDRAVGLNRCQTYEMVLRSLAEVQ